MRPILAGILLALIAVPVTLHAKAQEVGIGWPGPPPPATRYEFLSWLDDFEDSLVKPVVDLNRRPYYFAVGPSRGGIGTEEDPFTEPDITMLMSHPLLAEGTPNASIMLLRGQTWRGTIGIELRADGMRLGAWGEGPRPIVTSLYPLTPRAQIVDAAYNNGGWVDHGSYAQIHMRRGFGDLYSNAVWVSPTDAEDVDRAASHYYRLATSLDEVIDAPAGSGLFFFDPSAHVLTVNKRDGDTYAGLFATCSQKDGVLIPFDVDRAWVSDIYATGWGINGIGYAIRARASNGRVSLITGCRGDLAAKHSIGINTLDAGRGAILDTQAGACSSFLATGGATQFVAYSESKGRLLIARSEVYAYSLPGSNWGTKSFYSHSAGEGRDVNDIVVFRDIVTRANTSDVVPTISHLPDVDVLDDPIQGYRGYIVGEVFEGSPDGSLDMSNGADLCSEDFIRINSRLFDLYLRDRPYVFQTGGGGANRSGYLINCIVDIHPNVTSTSPGYLIRTPQGSYAPSALRVLHSAVRIKGPWSPGMDWLGFGRAGSAFTTWGSSLANSIYWSEDRSGRVGVNVPNERPDMGDEPGGHAFNAFYGVHITPWTTSNGAFVPGLDGSESAARVLRSAPPLDGPPPAALIGAGRPLASLIRHVPPLAYDIDGRRRALTEPTIGPHEPACTGDLTHTGTNPGDQGWGIPDGRVDLADLTFAVERWLAGDDQVESHQTGFERPDVLEARAFHRAVEAWVSSPCR
ncbi:MAG: hypothetical protein AAGG07_04685 [Planctomycetota bacterium]